MTPLRILTVDDEPLALRRLKLLLQSIPEAEFVGEASSCAEAIKSIEACKPDVLLLDVKMRDGTGFDVLEALTKAPTPAAVIFVTAFDQFAVRAFDSAVADYLLKPVAKDRLVRALNRAREQLQTTDAFQQMEELQVIVKQLRTDSHEGSERPYETEFWIGGTANLVQVSVDAIEYVSSEDGYVGLHTPGGVYLMRSSIRQFISRVEPGLFVRVHRRWLVKRSAIVELSIPRSGPPGVVLRSGRRLPTGRVHFKELRRILRRT